MYEIAFRRPTDMELNGIPIHHAGAAEVHAFIDEVIRRREKGIALNLNIHAFTLARRLPWMHELLRNAQLVFCDGDGVRWGLRILGHAPPPKTGTTRWIWDLAGHCAQHGYRLFLLGGRPGVAEEAGRRLGARFPALRIAGTQHGHFAKAGEENDAVMHAINASRPDVLLVCFGMPAQEKWIAEHWRTLDVHVFLKGGGVLDYVAGRVRPPPRWMVHANLEWLARIVEEPRRLIGRYAYDIPVFLGMVLRERLRKRAGRASRSPPAG